MLTRVQISDFKVNRIWLTFDQMVTSFIRRFEISAGAIWQEQGFAAARVYGDTGSVAKAEAEIESDPWRKWVTQVWTVMVPAGGAFAEDHLLKADSGVFLRAAAEYLRAHGAETVEGLTDYGRRMVREQVRIGMKKGESPTKIAIRIHNKVAKIKPSRARFIARNEVHAAANYGSMVAAREEANKKTYKVWVSRGDDRVRDIHREADGQKVQISKLFRVGGERLDHPGDRTHGAGPHNTCNCRCTVAYEQRR